MSIIVDDDVGVGKGRNDDAEEKKSRFSFELVIVDDEGFVFELFKLLNDITDDDVERRDIGEIKTSVIDDEAMFLFVLKEFRFVFRIFFVFRLTENR